AWQGALGDAVRSVGELLDLLALEPAQLSPALAPSAAAARDFPLRVPRGFVARMRLGDPADPLLLQVLPTVAELVPTPGLTADPDDKLAPLVRGLAAIPHVRRLRLHTRMPVILPERVDDGLLGWLGGHRFAPVVVLHANHAHELDVEVAGAVARLRAAGATVL